MSITLRELTRATWEECVDLAVAEESPGCAVRGKSRIFAGEQRIHAVRPRILEYTSTGPAGSPDLTRHFPEGRYEPRPAERGITTKKLISTEPGENDLDSILPDRAAHDERIEPVERGLVHRREDVGQRAEQVIP